MHAHVCIQVCAWHCKSPCHGTCCIGWLWHFGLLPLGTMVMRACMACKASAHWVINRMVSGDLCWLSWSASVIRMLPALRFLVYECTGCFSRGNGELTTQCAGPDHCARVYVPCRPWLTDACNQGVLHFRRIMPGVCHGWVKWVHGRHLPQSLRL